MLGLHKNKKDGKPEGLPLFLKSPRALDKAHHAAAGIKPVQTFAFAHDTNSIPVNAIEFIEAVKCYPIVFTSAKDPMPAVVVGLEQGNYFVDVHGKWKDHNYIPAYVRQYPFVFFDGGDEKFYLCIDEASAAFEPKASEGSMHLFADGEPTDLTKNALQFCTAFYNHHQVTKNFCADLAKHELLQPYHSQIKLNSGRSINLGGFTMIDEARFNALSDEVILDFRKKGWLAFIYLAFAASSNWKHLVDLAAAGETKAA